MVVTMVFFQQLVVPALFLSKTLAIEISPEGGCLKCGSDCLTAVRAALPRCVQPTVALGEAIVGDDLEFTIPEGRKFKVIIIFQRFFFNQMLSVA